MLAVARCVADCRVLLVKLWLRHTSPPTPWLQHALNMDAACVYWAAVMPETGTGTEGVGPLAGRYVRQLSGYRAFMPAPLPPEPPIRLEGDLRIKPLLYLSHFFKQRRAEYYARLQAIRDAGD